MLQKIKYYFQLIKFSHTIFALPFAFIGFFLAFEKYPTTWTVFGYVILSMIFARSAAMGFNRYLDRKIDKNNPRTENREIPAGKIKPNHALIFVILMSVAFILTTLLINRLVFYLSFVALFVVLGYSYTKRFTSLSHIVLGVGLGLAPIGAFLAVSSKFELLPILFSVVVLFWVSGFDIIYALQDYEYDKENNLNSIPVMMGKKNALLLSTFLHVISAVILIFIALNKNFSFLTWIGTAIFIIMLIYQHTLVKPNDLSKINLAFGTTNGIASVILSIFVIVDIFI